MAEPFDLFADLRRSPALASNDFDLFSDLRKPQVGVVEDVAKATGAGLVKGVVGLTALPGTIEQLGRMGLNKAAEVSGRTTPLVSGETALPNYQDIKGALEARTGKLYEPQTTAGQYAGTIAEFAPGMIIPGGAAASLGRRALTSVVAPAVVSETAGQMTKGSAAEPYARIGGAVAGAFVPGMIGRAIAPVRIDPARQKEAAVLAQEGVGVTAGQASGSNPLRYSESVALDTFGAGGRAKQVMEAQKEQFTRAALRRAGIDAPRATQDVLDAAFDRIGKDFDRAAAAIRVPLVRGTPSGPAPTAPVRRVQQIADDYERIALPATASPLPRKIANDLQNLAANNMAMDGRTYQKWRSDLGAAARGAQDSTTRDAIYSIQNTLDTAAEAWLRSTSRPIPGLPTPPNLSQLADDLRRARREYRNILVIERAATAAGENARLGFISPAALRTATVQQGRRAYARGQGDFAQLSNAGEALLNPLPQSGTSPRGGVQLVGAALGSGLGAMVGGPFGAGAGFIAGAAAPAVGQALLGRVTMSPRMQAYLGQQYRVQQYGAALRDLPRGRMINAAPGIMVQSNDYPTR